VFRSDCSHPSSQCVPDRLLAAYFGGLFLWSLFGVPFLSEVLPSTSRWTSASSGAPPPPLFKCVLQWERDFGPLSSAGLFCSPPHFALHQPICMACPFSPLVIIYYPPFLLFFLFPLPALSFPGFESGRLPPREAFPCAVFFRFQKRLFHIRAAEFSLD